MVRRPDYYPNWLASPLSYDPTIFYKHRSGKWPSIEIHFQTRRMQRAAESLGVEKWNSYLRHESEGHLLVQAKSGHDAFCILFRIRAAPTSQRLFLSLEMNLKLNNKSFVGPIINKINKLKRLKFHFFWEDVPYPNE